MIHHVNNMQGKYTDYPTAIEFHDMQNIIAQAKSMFESIPSNIRAKFENDPAKFLDYANNPENREEMLEMGFSVEHLPEPPIKPPAEEPVNVPATEPVTDPVPDPDVT